MGCGWRNFGKDWVHIDAGDYDHLNYDSIFDLNQFEDNTVDLIYASHVVEYFDRQQVTNLFAEWRRVLRPGGVLRLAVPNFYEISRLYSQGTYPLDSFTGLLYGRMPMGKETIYHRTVYDFSSLKRVLEDSSFSNVRMYDWRETEHAIFDDHSQAYLPHMNKDSGVLMSLNIECDK